jgi:hypothetical protein
MRLGTALFVLITFYGLNHSVSAIAQTVPAKSDSVQVTAPAAPAKTTSIVSKEAVAAEPVKEKKGLSKPGRAALYSAIIPGAGQFYNKDYWKVPIIYATGAVLGYFIINNHTNYLDYKQDYFYRTDGDSSTVDRFSDISGAAGDNFVRNRRDFYHRNRDLSIILSVIAYGLNIVEANVGAHMNEYDISDDLSMVVKPSLQFTALGTAPTPGLTLNFRLKN